MSALMECSGCSTAYDVSKRKPGKKVRCPRCKTVMVVPERDLDETQRPRVIQRLMEEWLVNLDVTVENNLTQEDSIRVINDIL